VVAGERFQNQMRVAVVLHSRRRVFPLLLSRPLATAATGPLLASDLMPLRAASAVAAIGRPRELIRRLRTKEGSPTRVNV
jgi:hypothetical protein